MTVGRTVLRVMTMCLSECVYAHVSVILLSHVHSEMIWEENLYIVKKVNKTFQMFFVKQKNCM